MKVIVLLDQIQAGLGGVERADTPLGGKKLAMGGAETLEKLVQKAGGDIIATFFCGTDYYQDNAELVQGKVVRMAQQMGADVVIAGPCYDYPAFTAMACGCAKALQDAGTKALVACAPEKNQETLAQYQDQLIMVKMPKKGGVGLSSALDHLVEGARILTNGGDLEAFEASYCY